MLLEQNAVPGLTNRWLAPVVGAAAVMFESTRRFFGAKAFVGGNPVRPEFFSADESVRAVHEIRWVPQVHGVQGAHGIHEVRTPMIGRPESGS